MKGIITAAEAAAFVEDSSCLVIQGSGGGVGEPSMIIKALGERFRQDASPRGITVVHSTGIGDKKEIGMDYLAMEGLVKRDIAGHLGMAPKMGRLVQENKVEAYNFPQGVLSHMYRAVAARTPGVITKVGLDTYIDPRIEGGKMNEVTTEDLVKVIELEGEEWLFWPRFKFDVGFIRGTTADMRGNISSEEEGALLEGISIAQAVRASGGVVIAQVKYLAEAKSLDPHLVRIPGSASITWWSIPSRNRLAWIYTIRRTAGISRCRWPAFRQYRSMNARSSRGARPRRSSRARWSIWVSASLQAWPRWQPKKASSTTSP